MSNLYNRLKRIEGRLGLVKEQRICKIFVRMRLREKSEAEERFFRDHHSDLDKYDIMIISWHDPYAMKA